MIARHAPGLALLLAAGMTLPAAAQARIDALDGVAHGRVTVQRLGAAQPERAALGMELLPGDLIGATGDSILVALSCAVRERTTTYRLRSPFRVLIDVPADSICHVNLLAGRADVLADTSTQTTAGGITLGSSGTQYSVEVVRTEAGAVLHCVVFDGRMRVLSRRGGAQITAGTNLLWTADGGVRSRRNSRAQLDSTAALYARFDIAEAERRNALPANREAAFAQLKALHLEVLANPADTSRRVALARRQLDFRVQSQAVFNLRRVNITTDARLRAHNIDPALVRSR